MQEKQIVVNNSINKTDIKETEQGEIPREGEYRNVGCTCTCVYILKFTRVIQVFMCNTRALDADIKLMLKQVKKKSYNISESRPVL